MFFCEAMVINRQLGSLPREGELPKAWRAKSAYLSRSCLYGDPVFCI
mgnify:CR=1 FL=1